MRVTIGPRSEGSASEVVEQGRFRSADEWHCVRLRLVEEREAKREALQETLKAAIAEGGEHNDDAASDAIEARAQELIKEGLYCQMLTCTRRH